MPDRDEQVDAAVAWYYRQAEAGHPPTRDEFLARYPGLRADLESFLADKAAFARAAGAPDPDATLAPGEAREAGTTVRYVGDYELLEELARGGMGVVFRARQASLNRAVAVKMILAGQLASAADVLRFRAEAESAANLDHPNVLPIYEVGEHRGQQYFSMKLVEGGSLADRLAESPRTAVRGLCALLSKVARAVHFAHQRGVLHRDLKPANVLLDADGTPYVTDFGLAKRADDAGLTQTGAVLGTPSYMPPEQARGEKGLTVAADVYALGAILYEALTGKPPFRGATAVDTLMQVLERDPEPPRSVNPDADRDLSVVALKCLEKDPTKRYASAAEFADDLDRWLAGEPIAARPVGPWGRARKWVRRHRTVAVLGTVIAVLAVVAVGGMALGYYETRSALADSDRQLHVSRMVLADRELADGNFDRADTLLRATPLDRRGWEWQYLHRKAHPEARLVEPQLASLNGLAVVDGGRTLLLGTSVPRRPVAVFGAATGELLTYFGAADDRDSGSYSLAAGGGVTAGMGGDTLTIWPAGGAAFAVKVPGRVTCLAVSPDGKWVAGGGHDKAAYLWDATSGKLLHTFGGYTEALTGVAFRPGKPAELATCSYRELVVWNAETKAEVRRAAPVLDAKQEKPYLLGLTYTPDGAVLALGSWGGVVLRLNADTGAALPPLRAPDPAPGRAVFFPTRLAVRADGKFLAAAGAFGNSEVYAWDLGTGELAARYFGHAAQVTGVGFTADGEVVTCSTDCTVRFWRVPAAPNPRELLRTGVGERVMAMAYSPDGSLLATGHEKGMLRVSDAATGAERFARPKAVNGSRAQAVAVSPDGKWVAVGGGLPPYYGKANDRLAGAVRVFDATTGEPGPELQVPPSPNGCGGLAFDPRGGRLAVATYGETVDLYDLGTGGLVRSFELPKEPDGYEPLMAWDVAFSADGKRLAAPNYWRGTATVWDTDTGRVVGRIDYRTNWGASMGAAEKIALTPDGRTLAMTVGSNVGVWEVSSGSLVARLPNAGTRALAFGPGGRLFAGGQRSDLWDPAAGQQVLRFPGSDCNAAAFTPDKNKLAVADGPVVRVYDATPRPDFPADAPRPRTGSISAIVVAAGAAFLAGWAAVLLAARWALIRLLPRAGRAAGKLARRFS